ncbi:hypothetical protein J6590_007254 [Homalodisca vitripennis]|nr:hypothetical protein J6590_007254 [Homalodisca vitripennis]
MPKIEYRKEHIDNDCSKYRRLRAMKLVRIIFSYSILNTFINTFSAGVTKSPRHVRVTLRGVKLLCFGALSFPTKPGLINIEDDSEDEFSSSDCWKPNSDSETDSDIESVSEDTADQHVSRSSSSYSAIFTEQSNDDR